MKNVPLNLILGILAIANVIYSFFRDTSTATILTFEVDIWYYRIVWAFLAVILIFNHFKEQKRKKKE
ncbi:hypothetical protein JM658_07240 [Joostella atrarenae]|uniref:Uncharacterized protein n=1 Tax=Joostella atrarenae TaxID=679257 RepID=A0ABS9J2G0_9FLAO|nr:hypothetical protein [Joostella atrarenae]MCF8714625.1 hypothetical protein [Joostella atrarenae]